ncbi:c-type cytochrome [Pseudomonas retamae]|uniref:C-type cytochrome n=1 Tax=Pseudomonas retamae TaxID=702110 RepID=A0ABW7DFT2_9PSED
MKYLVCTSFAALLASQPSPAQAENVNGKALYFQRCAVCHGPDIKGTGPLAKKSNPSTPKVSSRAGSLQEAVAGRIIGDHGRSSVGVSLLAIAVCQTSPIPEPKRPGTFHRPGFPVSAFRRNCRQCLCCFSEVVLGSGNTPRGRGTR